MKKNWCQQSLFCSRQVLEDVMLDHRNTGKATTTVTATRSSGAWL
ncbi:hypothetical protein ACLK1T_16455 [Escherichia coli]